MALVIMRLAMSDVENRTHAAVQKAYNAVLHGEPACDNVAFEAAMTVYRRLYPDVEEAKARDDVSQIIADGVSSTVLTWVEESGGLEALHAQSAAFLSDSS